MTNNDNTKTMTKVNEHLASPPPPASTGTAAGDREKEAPHPPTCGNGDSLAIDAKPKMTSRHLDNLKQDKPTNGTGGFHITTTAPTPQASQPNPPTAPPPNENNSRVATGDISPYGCSGVTESQTTELGSNLLSYHRISRAPSLHSSSSVESDSSSMCDSLEVDPIQASEDQPSRDQPWVSGGGIRPGGCSNSGPQKPNRQRCKRCTKLKKESNALREELIKVKQTLSMEREQNSMQVNDFKQQLFIAEQNATGYTNYINNVELRHQRAENMIQKLQREIQLLEAEKSHLKRSYDLSLSRCEMYQAELRRADSLQCPEFVDGECVNTVNKQLPIVTAHEHEQAYYDHGIHANAQHGYDKMQDPQWITSMGIPPVAGQNYVMHTPMNPHTL